MHTFGGKPAHIESGARSHMVSQHSVNEQRGSVYIYKCDCTTGHSLYSYINKWPSRGFWNGISSCVISVFPPHIYIYIYICIIYIYIYIYIAASLTAILVIFCPIQSTFDEYDKDQSGSFNIRELRGALKSLGEMI